ncbi:MAG: hypothetical protein AAGI69_07745 [Cyanobacteria bacterium P01_H01_bin.21]
MDETGAGGNSTAVATSPSGETSSSSQEVFEPGATSSQSSGRATATTDGATTSTDVVVPADKIDQGSNSNPDSEAPTDNSNTLVFQIGSEGNEVLNSTTQQDIMVGSEGSNIFSLSDTGKGSINDADVIANFDINTDYLQLSAGLTIDDLVFEQADFNNDENFESTVIRLGEAGDILAVVLNTALTDTALIKASSDNADTSVSTTPSSETAQEQNTAVGNESTGCVSEYPIDYLIGTDDADVLISDCGPDILIGGGGPDTFVIERSDACISGCPSFVLDFNPEEGDKIQLNANFFIMDDIVLENYDLDNNGITESTAIQLADGGILAVIPGTVDPLGNTTFSEDALTHSPHLN